MLETLEAVEREYYSLLTKVIYDSFEGEADASEESRLSELAEKLVDLSAPNIVAIAAK